MDTINDIAVQFYAALADTNNLIILALVGLGIMLKRMDYIKNDIIPLILLVVGVLASGFLIKPVAVGVLKGIIYAAIAMMTYEVIVKYIIAWAEKKFGVNIEQPPEKKDDK